MKICTLVMNTEYHVLDEELLNLLFMLFNSSSLSLSWYLKSVKNTVTTMIPIRHTVKCSRIIWGIGITFKGWAHKKYRWRVYHHSELLMALFFVFTVTLTVSYFAGSCVWFSASLWSPNEGAQRDIQVSELQDRYVRTKQGLFSVSDLSGKLAHVYKPSHPTVTNSILAPYSWLISVDEPGNENQPCRVHDQRETFEWV